MLTPKNNYRLVIKGLTELCVDSRTTMEVWKFICEEPHTKQEHKILFLKNLEQIPTELINRLTEGKPSEVAVLISSSWSRISPEARKLILSRRSSIVTRGLVQLDDLPEYPQVMEELSKVADLPTRAGLAKREDVPRKVRIQALQGSSASLQGASLRNAGKFRDMLYSLNPDLNELNILAASTLPEVLLWVAESPQVDTAILQTLTLQISRLAYSLTESEYTTENGRLTVVIDALKKRKDINLAGRNILQSPAFQKGKPHSGNSIFHFDLQKISEASKNLSAVIKVENTIGLDARRIQAIQAGTAGHIISAVGLSGPLTTAEATIIAERWSKKLLSFSKWQLDILIKTLNKETYLILAEARVRVIGGEAHLVTAWRDFFEEGDSAYDESILAIAPAGWFLAHGTADPYLSQLWLARVHALGRTLDEALKLIVAMQASTLLEVEAVLK